METEMTMENKYATCTRCGCLLHSENVHEFDWLSGRYCDDCIEELIAEGEIYICDECGEYCSPDDVHEVDGVGFVCDSCVNHDYHYFYCADCGEVFNTNREDYRDVQGHGMVCESCYEHGDYYICKGCFEVYCADDMEFVEDRWGDDVPYCPDCYSRYARKIKKVKDYSYKPHPNFKVDAHDIFFGSDDPASPLMLGVELEIDGGDDSEEVAGDVMDFTEDIYCKHDGSLHSNGVELVTHPASLNYHLNDLGWDRVCQIALDHNYRSHNTTTCGFHVHVGRCQLGKNEAERADTIANILILLSSHRFNIEKFTRRSADRLDQWASFEVFYPYTPKDDVLSYVNYYPGDRYKALNLCNYNTIEFRIFRGTLKANTIKATLQFVSNIVQYAKEHTFEECLKSKWMDVASYVPFRELDTYLEERNLNGNTAPWFGYTYNITNSTGSYDVEDDREDCEPDDSYFTTGIRF